MNAALTLWFERFGELLALGGVAAIGFVTGTYLLAVLLTKGRFGWPGFRYFFAETWCVCVSQSILPFGWLSRAKLGSVAGAPRPVVLVHGYTQNRTNFVWITRYLSRLGLGPFFGFDYWSLQPIERSAEQLAAFVENVRAATGASEVDLLCHSLGGLVARTYVDLKNGHGVVRRIVTLGTPHRGIRRFRRGFGASVRDMHPATGFIARLDGAVTSPRVAYHSIFSSHDNIVFPFGISTLGARGTDVAVERHGHFGLLFSEEVASLVHRALVEEGRSAGREGRE